MNENNEFVKIVGGDREKDILFALEQDLPKKVVNAVTEAVKSMLIDATDKDTGDIYGDYSRSLRVRQEVDGTVADSVVTIRFRRIAECSSSEGWKLTIKGSVTDGRKTYESEWDETPANYIGKGEVSDLVAMMGDVGLTDWTYNTIEQFFEYLRDNLADMEEEKKESVA